MQDRYQQQEHICTATMADRVEWERATADSRRLAIAADGELRRRHPHQRIEPLLSAEPAPVSDADCEQMHLAPGQKIAEMASWITSLATQRQAFRGKLEERQGLKVPTDPHWDDLGDAFPAWEAVGRKTILQPPKPEITPSAKILQLAAGHDTEPESR